MEQQLGTHLVVEIKECCVEALNNMDLISQALVEGALKAGATVLDTKFHQFKPQGVSGVVVLSESHISIHTWPEYRYAAVDIFTCGTHVDPDKAASHIASVLGAQCVVKQSIPRGF